MRLGGLRRRISDRGCWVTLALLLTLASAPMRGQSLPARTRSAELTAFGMFTSLEPDYGPYVNPGFTVGGGFTKLMKFTSLSLEVRYKNAPGVEVGEKTAGGGPRFEYRWTRIHLYADLFASAGRITFANRYARGSNSTGYNGSVVYTYGGGIDYDITGQWAARFDAQSEHWDLEEKPKILLAPTALSVGIIYKVRFPRDRSRW
jgi:hypothetical protein